MYKYILVLGVSFLVFVSCKKDETTPATSSSNGPYTPPGDGSPSNATQFSGIFNSGHYYYEVCANTYVGDYALALISSTPVANNSYTASGIGVNKVYYNNDSLSFIEVTKTYERDKIPLVNAETWSVSGANGIPSFSINVDNGLPFYTTPVPLPTTISKSTTFSISLFVSFTYSGSITLTDGTSACRITKRLIKNKNIIIFTAAEMGVFSKRKRLWFY